MTKTMLQALAACGLAAVVVAARVSAGQEVTAAPGQMTRARVWVENRMRAEAIPVVVQDVVRGAPPLRVQLVDVPGQERNASVVAHAARQRWEYRSVVVPRGDDVAVALTGAGIDSWEAAGLTTAADGNVVVLLKRPQ
jgi:hypothetical protein